MFILKNALSTGTIPHLALQGHWTELYRNCFVQRGKNRCQTSNSPILNIFIFSGDIRHQTSNSTAIGPNFACFWPLKFFKGRSPEILNRHFKTQLNTDHPTKFHAGRPTQLGDTALKKKNIWAKT